NKRQEFLGGGPKFNKVGETGPVEPEITPDGTRTARMARTMMIAAVVLLLAGVLYFLSEQGFGGMTQTTGHNYHGVSPDAHPEVAPDKVSPNGR
ncbi:MAG: hypothetical protein M3Y13_15960, partial [Armatimonadota bacterium]|nr:hypothetical protein [Armatimonadota bacterium]